MKFRFVPTMFFILGCLMPTPASATKLTDWAYDYFIDGATLKLGVGTRIAGVQVKRLSDDATGKIVQRDLNSYFITYSTSPIYFSIDRSGLTFIFNLSGFSANKQEIDGGKFVDTGSRASGQFYYIVPTAFYEWGNYLKGTYARIGAGLGLGAATFSGDATLTSTTNNDSVALNRRSTSLTWATSLMLEGHWNHWGLTFQYAGPTYKNDKFQFDVQDISANLGYQFVF